MIVIITRPADWNYILFVDMTSADHKAKVQNIWSRIGLGVSGFDV